MDEEVALACCGIQRKAPASEGTITNEKKVFLLMPSDEKWFDKALLIQDYFHVVHAVDITIVDTPPASGVLITLEKENLISAAECARHGGHDLETLVLSDSSLYSTMDDKAEDAWRQLPSDKLRFTEIPTLNMLTASRQSVDQFVKTHSSLEYLMLKPSDEAASVGQEVISVHDKEGLQKYVGRAYIAQPFFNQHKILTIDFLAIEGDVKGHHCFYVDGPIQNSHWKTGLYQQVLCNAPAEILFEFDRIRSLTQSLSKQLGLNGIFEIEYLYDGSQAYFLELNLLPGLYGIDDCGLMPVLEQVVVPYLQHFHVDVEPQTDFTFGPRGQFYPPSGCSAAYYKRMFDQEDQPLQDGASVSTDYEEDAGSLSVDANEDTSDASDPGEK
jgi:hypothetical protein